MSDKIIRMDKQGESKSKNIVIEGDAMERFAEEATRQMEATNHAYAAPVYYDSPPGFINFELPRSGMIVSATPDWDGLVGVSVQIDDREGHNLYADHTFVPWSGNLETDVAMWLGAVLAHVQSFERRAARGRRRR